MLLIGSKVNDADNNEYQIEKQIGSGGFGQVFQLIKTKDGSYFALKTANTHGMTSGEFAALQNEGKLAGNLNHENIIKVHYFHDGSVYPALPPYLLMDFADGGTLKSVLETKQNAGTQFSNDDLRSIFIQICNGMRAINEKIIHRDFHLGNVLIQNNILKITDFGLSKYVDTATRTNSFKGVQHILYKSPESWKMQKNTIQMDMYSVGVAFYEIATLKYPYAFPNKRERWLEVQDAHFFDQPLPPKTVNSQLTGTLDEMILKLVKKKPSDRFGSWDEVLNLINSDSSPSSKNIDVNSLLEKSRATDHSVDSKKIAEEKARKDDEEKMKQLKYAVSTIKEEFSKLIDAFNEQTKTTQLKLRDSGNKIGFSIYSPSSKGSVIGDFFIAEQIMRKEQDIFRGGFKEIPDMLKFRSRPVIFWGSITNEIGRGFNLLLTYENDEDLYGSWSVLRHSWHALVRHNPQQPKPFALTEWEDFSRQVRLLGAMGQYETQVSPFQIDDLKYVIEDIL